MRNLYILFALSVGLFVFSPTALIESFLRQESGSTKTAIPNKVSENQRLFACPPVTTFSEDFNTVVTPNLPTCWEKIGDRGTVATQGTDANSAPNALYLASTGFVAFEDTNPSKGANI